MDRQALLMLTAAIMLQALIHTAAAKPIITTDSGCRSVAPYSYICSGSPTITCDAVIGTNVKKIEIKKDNIILESGTVSSLSINFSGFDADNAGEYKCVVTDTADVVTTSAFQLKLATSTPWLQLGLKNKKTLHNLKKVQGGKGIIDISAATERSYVLLACGYLGAQNNTEYEFFIGSDAVKGNMFGGNGWLCYFEYTADRAGNYTCQARTGHDKSTESALSNVVVLATSCTADSDCTEGGYTKCHGSPPRCIDPSEHCVDIWSENKCSIKKAKGQCHRKRAMKNCQKTCGVCS